MLALRNAFDLGTAYLEVCAAAVEIDNPGSLHGAYVGAGLIAFDDPCGQLVVTIEQTFRSKIFPLQAIDKEFCVGGQLCGTILVVLARCVPTMDSRGTPPTPAAMSAAYEMLYADAAAIWNACLVDPTPDDEWDRAGGTQTFVGAEGGMIGVETRFTIGLGMEEWDV